MKTAVLLLASALAALGSPGAFLLAASELGDWYVDGLGSDGNHGRTPFQPLRTIGKALEEAEPGDTIFVGAGTYDMLDAGEKFPLVIENGVQIFGPGDGTAVVDSRGSGMAGFELAARGAPTVLGGLTIVSDVACVTAVDVPSVLQVTNCELTGLHGFNNQGGGEEANRAGNGVIRFEGNTVTASAFGIAWAGTESGEQEITFSGNTILSARVGLAAFALSNLGGDGSEIMLDALVTGNRIEFAEDRGIYVRSVSGNPGVNVTVTAEVSDNLLASCGETGAALECEVDAAPGTIRLYADVLRNEVVNCGRGLRVACLGDSSGSATLSAAVSSNVVSSCVGDGIEVLSTSMRAGSAAFDATLNGNTVTATRNGIRVLASASFLGSAGLEATVRGNTVTANRRNGVILSSSFTSSAIAEMQADLGDFGSGEPGLNTFAGNNVNAGDFYECSLEGLSGGRVVPGEGNWWGARTEADVERGIFHVFDDPSVAELDFRPYLVDPLDFRPNAVDVLPGFLVILTAEEQSAFLGKTAAGVMAVLVGPGVSVPYEIRDNGERVAFQVPGFAGPGPLQVTVVNPAGQSGSTMLNVVEQSSVTKGNCFVATAAYGDADAPEVGLLRAWRDECLAGTAVGRSLVKAYYAASPPLAATVADRPWARAAARAALAPMVGVARLWLEAPWVLLGAAGVVLWRLARRRSG